MLYFGYGSNLDEERLKGRCSSAQYLGKGVLYDYQLCFMENNRGKIRANIEEQELAEVRGGVFYIDDEERKNLDKAEGHPKVYERKNVMIKFEDNKE